MTNRAYSCQQLAAALVRDLHLSRPPIGIAFLEEPPPAARRYADAVPSACAFWKAAESGFFYATAEDHYNCPLGAITQGFPLPRQVGEKAMSLIEQMGKISYLEAAEAGNVPAVKKNHKVVVYGRLQDFGETAPDVVLLVGAPFQAMLLAEAAGVVSWSGAPAGRTLGRPACAVIPVALASGATTVSLGCMGARTFAGINQEELLVAIPASALVTIEERLPVILAANANMRDYYREQKSRFQ